MKPSARRFQLEVSRTGWGKILWALLLGVLGAGWVLPIAAQAQEANTKTARGEALFARRVWPMLKTKCFACHGDDPQDVRGELSLLTREGLLKGGESGEPALVPGKPEDSQLYLAVNWEGLEMPPKQNDRLTQEQIADVRAWIAAGASWPDETRRAELLNVPQDLWQTAEGIAVNTSGGLSDDWTNRNYPPENLWAYRPLRTKDNARPKEPTQNPIDGFLDQRFAELKLTPAPPANRRALIRRATFDLIGLPPTPEEAEAFVRDPAPDEVAFRNVIERLLSSPHYGEQWGRHWLDVARYADSSGYANDYERGNAWRYRDYVVRAFNDDKPYDQFIREQIAGDELDATNSDHLIAVGFLRLGPWELTGMEVAQVARQRFLDDVTDAVGQVFLGQVLQCARCHDHKFDPVPTRDYYAIQAVFASTQFAARPAAFLPEENTAGFEERKYVQERLTFYQQTLGDLNKKRTIAAAREWFLETGGDSTAFEEAVAELARRQKIPPTKIPLEDVRRLLAKRNVDPALIPPRHAGFGPRDFGQERIARKGIERLEWRMERYEPWAFSVYSGPTQPRKAVTAPLRMPQNPEQAGELEPTFILAGGDPFSPKEPVAPGTLSAVNALADSSGNQPKIPTSSTGRRRALADWIASEQNPLTARVMVNRLWHWHFGQAIAANPNNFGSTGKKPTHPELLDWLTAKFMAEGWSVKTMHRLIMNSQAYRRASAHPQPKELAAKDPAGTSYAVFQPRRLEAEELRDAMLFVSGELNPALGGIPVRPEMNREAALQPRQVMGTFAEAWQPSPKPEERHRRSIYVQKLRGLRDPFLEVFNAPSPDVSCEAREASTVSPQVFALFNSESSFDRALALAQRVLQENHSREATIKRLFPLVLSRPAKPEEIAKVLAHWEKMTARHRSLQFAPPVRPTEVIREAVEENTGEKFTFVEPLEAAADFIPDLKPADATAEVRGLAEVCLVLFNTNEFIYVD